MPTKATIILIDPKQERREKLDAILRKECATLQGVGKVEEAISLARRTPPDLFLHACDSIADLPAIRRLKMNLPLCPLVAYTENFREITRLRAVEIGADEMVQIEVLPQEIVAFLPSDLTEDAGRERYGAGSETGAKGQMYLQLNVGELSNALQFLCMASRHGQLVLTFGNETKGNVFLKDGSITHADYLNKNGIEAMARMLMQGETEALFMEGREPQEQTIQMPISQILLEATVMADELGVQRR